MRLFLALIDLASNIYRYKNLLKDAGNKQYEIKKIIKQTKKL